MKLLAILALACTVLIASAQVCPPLEVIFLLDQSENAQKAASVDRARFPFDILQQAIRTFLTYPSIANAANIRIGAYGYSSTSPQVTIIPEGSSPSQALNFINLIGSGTNAGSWSYRGLEMIKSRPTYQRSYAILISSQGSDTNSRRNIAFTEYKRILNLGWNLSVIAVQGANTIDNQELTMLNGGRQPTTLRDPAPLNPVDPKGYNELSGEFINVINRDLCTDAPTTTTTTTPAPRPTRLTTQRVYGLCSECLFEGGYGFDFHPSHCDLFYQCFPGSDPILKMCPEGTFWDGVQCNHISKVDCPTAICESSASRSTFPSGKCCNKYYQCTNGELISTICPEGQIYDEVFKGCQSVANLTESCRATNKLLCDLDLNGPIGPGGCDGYAPDPFGNPCKYQFHGLSLSTAPGTTWNQQTCSLAWADRNMCLGDNASDRDLATQGPVATCTSVFLATYNGGSLSVYSERLQRQLNVYASLQEATLTNNGVGFTSQMSDPFLYYYYFNNKEMPSNVAFRTRFRVDVGPGSAEYNVEHDILSNRYCSQCRETISFTVSATSNTRFVVTATFLTTLGNTVSTSAIIEKSNPSDLLELVVIFGESTVYGKLYAVSESNTVSGTSDFNTVPKVPGAGIEINRCGLQVGRGTHRHFIGLVDEFAYFENCQNITSILR